MEVDRSAYKHGGEFIQDKDSAFWRSYISFHIVKISFFLLLHGLMMIQNVLLQIWSHRKNTVDLLLADRIIMLAERTRSSVFWRVCVCVCVCLVKLPTDFPLIWQMETATYSQSGSEGRCGQSQSSTWIDSAADADRQQRARPRLLHTFT